VRTRRDVIDYALKRRARLGEVRTGLVTTSEACDAHPHLVLAGRNYGSVSPAPCPICGRPDARIVRFAYGDELGQSAGQAKTEREIERMEPAAQAVSVYVVEVCTGCKWNHLLQSFVIGQGAVSPIARGRSRAH
jgi:hypothetical protein